MKKQAGTGFGKHYQPTQTAQHWHEGVHLEKTEVNPPGITDKRASLTQRGKTVFLKNGVGLFQCKMNELLHLCHNQKGMHGGFMQNLNL